MKHKLIETDINKISYFWKIKSTNAINRFNLNYEINTPN